MLANYNKKTLPFFVRLPLRHWHAREIHSDAVEYVLSRVVLNGQESLHPVHIGSLFAEDLLEEFVCSLMCDISLHLVRECANS